MKNYFDIKMTGEQLQSMSVLGLAHIGDAVYELLVRTWLCGNGKTTSKSLHFETVGFVKAPAQAKATARILDKLTEEELAVYKRGRNAKVNSVPKNADISEYHSATGLETLFGYLYLKGSRDRISELFGLIVEGNYAS
ncbi:MAG: ribonuclease III domain-containing protein [Oscillospiraceae bacterium]|nr:ribonuclease III domain-containing protein [Oscillospiraceae bacterium]